MTGFPDRPRGFGWFRDPVPRIVPAWARVLGSSGRRRFPHLRGVVPSFRLLPHKRSDQAPELEKRLCRQMFNDHENWQR